MADGVLTPHYLEPERFQPSSQKTEDERGANHERRPDPGIEPHPGRYRPRGLKGAMIDKRIPLIEEAGRQGVQVLCLQEIFYGPYFCPSQDSKWYDTAEAIPDGETTRMMQELAKEHGMVLVVPIYESGDGRGLLQQRGRHRRGR